MLLNLIYALYHKVACKRLISIEILLFDVLALLKYCWKQVALTNVIWNDRTFHASVLLVEDPKTLRFFLDSVIGTVISIIYPRTFQIILAHTFSQEYENFPLFVVPSSPVFRGYFRPKDWHFRVTGSTSLVFYSWPKMCDRFIASAILVLTS